MLTRIKNKYSFIVSVLLVITMFVSKYKQVDPIHSSNPCPIAWDLYGYYLYLPATFIYHDLGLQNMNWIENIEKKYDPSTTRYQFTAGEGNRKIIIYNIGYAFIYAPAFAIANLSASALGFEADGFSKPYQLALLITAFLFSFAGIVMFRKIALHFFSDKVAALLMITVFLGTNYFFHATFDGVMPHNLLFTINCFIIWFTIRWHQQNKIKDVFMLALLLGLASICRPTELLFLLLPVLWNVLDKKTFFKKIGLIKTNFLQIFLLVVVLIVIVSIQFVYYKYSSGKFTVLNLHSESFSFLHPYTFQFLFSYKKGWLLYTPVMIFTIIGFYSVLKRNKNIFIPLFSFFVVYVYVVSSWECWWYAGSFSQRPMIECYPVLLFPLGYFLQSVFEKLSKLVRYSVSVLLIFFIVLNLFQVWQFMNGIIHNERMTKKYYWEVFGKTNVDESVKQYLSVNRDQNNFNEYENYADKYYGKELCNYTFENDVTKNKSIIDTLAVSGKHCFMLNDEVQFSPSFSDAYNNLTTKSYVWLRASVWVYLTAPYTESNSCIVVLTQTHKKPYKYVTTKYENTNIKPFEWTKIYLDYLTPDIRHKEDKIVSYFWNIGTKPVFIDDFKLEIFDPKVDYE